MLPYYFSPFNIVCLYDCVYEDPLKRNSVCILMCCVFSWVFVNTYNPYDYELLSTYRNLSLFVLLKSIHFIELSSIDSSNTFRLTPYCWWLYFGVTARLCISNDTATVHCTPHIATTNQGMLTVSTELFVLFMGRSSQRIVFAGEWVEP